uniref:Uncharacterized protein n=1 Tax=Rhizophora mucronata TaxID=61149 RepID=A0A2P2NV47_RHIMU
MVTRNSYLSMVLTYT